ncbi:MAG: BamA/TamA family outer membrane protein [Candidatus Gastranaerophilales bacterium]|nr:BamA/TamA family outer membrane protein [Candidatus Gastranaerophilales bacterium]
MLKIYKRLVLILTVVCLLWAQSPACAFSLKHPFQKKKQKQEQIVPSEDTVTLQEETTKDKPLDENSEEDLYYNGEDNLVYVKTLEIMGNNMVDTAFIKGIVTSKEGHIYDRKTVTHDLNNLYATGYFTQNIRAVPIRLDDGNMRLRIVVEENPPVTGFTIIGNDSVPSADIKKILEPLEGSPQNIIELNRSIEHIQELYSARGYILSRVTEVTDDPDGIINLKVSEGRIGDINVTGNYKTKDFIVKRNILSSPGEVYNENVMRSDIMRLMGTQAFRDVQRDIVMNENTGLYDVTVNLEEQRTGKISVGVGIDSSSGFFGSVGFGENNFRGLGQKINLNLMAGTGILMDDNSVLRRANWQAELSFLEPHFKKEGQSLGFRAFLRSFGSYQVPLAVEKRYGGDITLARVFEKYPRLTGSISIGAEEVDLSEGDITKITKLFAEHGLSMKQRHEQLEGGFYLHAIPAIVYDTRDNPTNPRHGLIAKISLEEALAITGADSYGKLEGVIRKFIPAGRKSSVVVTARAGGTLNGDVPEFAMYTLGGPYSIRGFNISEVGMGDGYMMGSVEYRTPIPFIDRLTSNTFINNIRLAGFVDAGRVFSQSLSDEIYDRPGYAITAGVGLRIFIPGLGPINLDYGYPLTNTKGSRSNGFFTFGMGDML